MFRTQTASMVLVGLASRVLARTRFPSKLLVIVVLSGLLAGQVFAQSNRGNSGNAVILVRKPNGKTTIRLPNSDGRSAQTSARLNDQTSARLNDTATAITTELNRQIAAAKQVSKVDPRDGRDRVALVTATMTLNQPRSQPVADAKTANTIFRALTESGQLFGQSSDAPGQQPALDLTPPGTLVLKVVNSSPGQPLASATFTFEVERPDGEQPTAFSEDPLANAVQVLTGRPYKLQKLPQEQEQRLSRLLVVSGMLLQERITGYAPEAPKSRDQLFQYLANGVRFQQVLWADGKPSLEQLIQLGVSLDGWTRTTTAGHEFVKRHGLKVPSETTRNAPIQARSQRRGRRFGRIPSSTKRRLLRVGISIGIGFATSGGGSGGGHYGPG